MIAPCMHPMYWERNPAVRKKREGWYKKWLQESKKANSRPLYMWNYDFPVTYQVYYGVSRGKMVKGWLNDGIQGIYHCGSPEPVGMYVTNKLYENKNLDPKQLVDEYFELYFGPVKKPMREFYDEMVDLTTNPKNYPLAPRGGYIHIRLAEPNFVFTDKRIRKLRVLMNRAKELAKDQKYQKRIAGWEKVILKPIEKNVYDYQGKKATEYAARVAKQSNQKQADGFIPSVSSYPGDHWYAKRPPVALVDASGMKEGEAGVFGTKTARFMPNGHGFYWPSYFPDQGAWFMFDLGGVYDLDQMHIWNYNDKDGNIDWGLKDVTIAYAADENALRNDNWTVLRKMRLNKAFTEDWKTVVDQSKNRTSATAAGDFHSFNPIKARYVRIKNLQWLCEAKVYSTPNGKKIKVNSTNKASMEKYELAKGKPVISSGSESAERDIKFINDGIEGKDSAWWAAGNPRWGQIDLGKAMNIEQMWLQPWWDDQPNGRVAKYTIEASVKGNGKPGADNVINFGGKKVRYIYIHAKGPQGKANWRSLKDAKTGNVKHDGIFPDAKIGLGKVRFYGTPMQAPMPVLSFVDDNLKLKLKLSVPGVDNAKIYYTIDGSIPDKNSPLYNEPFAIFADVVLRAKAYAPGKLASEYAPMIVNYASAYKTLIEKHEVAKAKPVTASGSESPERGIKFINDGIEGKNSAWWAAGNPRWGQIDLGKATNIGQIWLQPWWDDQPNGRAVKYTIEVSVDGKNWKQIIDWSKNNTPSTAGGDLHRFKPVMARYIKIKNLQWLCEIKVYKLP